MNDSRHDSIRNNLLKLGRTIGADETRLKFSTPHSTCPGEICENTGRKWGETTYQRSLLRAADFCCGEGAGVRRVRWLDGELPVDFSGKSRRRCLDLVGTIDGNPLICELKYANPNSESKSDSPQKALWQLSAYYWQVMLHSGQLTECHHTKRDLGDCFWNKAAGGATLMALANETYWDRWESSRKYGMKQTLEFAASCAACFTGLDVEILVCSGPEYDSQQNNGRWVGTFNDERSKSLKILSAP